MLSIRPAAWWPLGAGHVVAFSPWTQYTVSCEMGLSSGGHPPYHLWGLGRAGCSTLHSPRLHICAATSSKVAVLLKEIIRELLWWLSGKESACQCRRRRFDPCVGKIPPAWGATKPMHDSYWARALEPGSRNYGSLRALEAALHKRSHYSGKRPQPQLGNSLPLPQLEKSPCKQQRPSSAKTN